MHDQDGELVKANVRVADLYTAYLRYCNEAKMKPLRFEEFGVEMRKLGIGKKRLGRRGDRSNHYIGIELFTNSRL